MLESDHVLLRPWSETDLPALSALRNDVALQRELMARARGSSLSATRAWLERRTEDPLDVFLIIAGREDTSTVRGFVQLTGADSTLRAAMLGICVLPPWHGHGVALEALELLCFHARDVLNLRKVTLEVLSSNSRAVSFYRKCGFHQVGVRRSHFPWGGEWLDVLVMERLLT